MNRIDGALNTTPYWIMQLPQAFVPDHSQVFQDYLLTLIGAVDSRAGLNGCAPPSTAACAARPSRDRGGGPGAAPGSRRSAPVAADGAMNSVGRSISRRSAVAAILGGAAASPAWCHDHGQEVTTPFGWNEESALGRKVYVRGPEGKVVVLLHERSTAFHQDASISE